MLFLFFAPKVLFLKSLFGFAGRCASVDGDGAVFFSCQGTSANAGVYLWNEGSKGATMNCKTHIENPDIYSIVSWTMRNFTSNLEHELSGGFYHPVYLGIPLSDGEGSIFSLILLWKSAGFQWQKSYSSCYDSFYQDYFFILGFGLSCFYQVICQKG